MDEHFLLNALVAMLAVLWGIQLWEVRALRAEGKEFREAIANLTTSITVMSSEYAHKVSKNECAELRRRCNCNDKG
jgi:hypothetical protein